MNNSDKEGVKKFYCQSLTSFSSCQLSSSKSDHYVCQISRKDQMRDQKGVGVA